MYLFRQVMDKGIVDCNGHKAGRVDDLILKVGDDGRPVVHAIQLQRGTLAALLGGKLDRLAHWFERRMLGEDARPATIGWEHVTEIDVVVHLNVDRESAGLLTTEDSMWKRWIAHLPFAMR